MHGMRSTHGFALLSVIIFGILFLFVMTGLSTFLVQSRRAQVRSAASHDVHVLRRTLANMIDCDATFADNAITNKNDAAQCPSTTLTQSGPWLHLRRKALDSTVRWLTGDLDGTTHAGLLDRYSIRATCSSADQTLVVRATKFLPIDFSGPYSLLVGSIDQSNPVPMTQDVRSLCYGQAAPDDVTATAVIAGYGGTCAIVGGGLYCWGSSFPGGTPAVVSVSSRVPMPISGMPSSFTSVSVSVNRPHGCVVSNGGVSCWGKGEDGTLGDGSGNTSSATPKPALGLSSGFVTVGVGFISGCAINATGETYCWGKDDNGNLGLGTGMGTHEPPQKITGLNAISVTLGKDHTCAVLSDHSAKCWGKNDNGRIGDGTTTDRYIPTAVTGLGSGVSSISADPIGSHHTCAVQNGAAKCWGGAGGQLGVGDSNARLTPTQVVGLTSGVTAIAAGHRHTCAIVNGGAKCWGQNVNGELGNGVFGADETTPVQVAGLTTGVTAISCGDRHCCALVGGRVKCWGLGSDHQLGRGDNGADSNVPVSPAGL